MYDSRYVHQSLSPGTMNVKQNDERIGGKSLEFIDTVRVLIHAEECCKVWSTSSCYRPQSCLVSLHVHDLLIGPMSLLIAFQ